MPLSNQPSNHPSTQGLHTLKVWLENSSFSPKKIGKVIPEASGWKVRMSLWRLWRKWPISSESQWNLFILECHLIDPCDPWECFVPLTTCDLSKNWVELLQTFWKREKVWLWLCLELSVLVVYNPFPIKLGGCVESSTFCPFLSWKFHAGWFHITLVALGDTVANYTQIYHPTYSCSLYSEAGGFLTQPMAGDKQLCFCSKPFGSTKRSPAEFPCILPAICLQRCATKNDL